MSQVLIVRSSPRGDASVSGQLASRLATGLRAGGADVVERALADRPPAVLDGELVGAMFTAAGERDAGQRARIAGSDALIAELAAADTVVIAAGMYNFGVPVALKAWFDQVLRAGSTFRYTAHGPEGLLRGKRAIILAATGGVYSDGPARQVDFFVPYVQHLLAFIGITDVRVVRAEGLALGPDAARDATGRALAAVDALVAELVAERVAEQGQRVPLKAAA